MKRPRKRITVSKSRVGSARDRKKEWKKRKVERLIDSQTRNSTESSVTRSVLCVWKRVRGGLATVNGLNVSISRKKRKDERRRRKNDGKPRWIRQKGWDKG